MSSTRPTSSGASRGYGVSTPVAPRQFPDYIPVTMGATPEDANLEAIESYLGLQVGEHNSLKNASLVDMALPLLPSVLRPYLIMLCRGAVSNRDLAIATAIMNIIEATCYEVTADNNPYPKFDLEVLDFIESKIVPVILKFNREGKLSKEVYFPPEEEGVLIDYIYGYATAYSVMRSCCHPSMNHNESLPFLLTRHHCIKIRDKAYMAILKGDREGLQNVEQLVSSQHGKELQGYIGMLAYRPTFNIIGLRTAYSRKWLESPPTKTFQALPPNFNDIGTVDDSGLDWIPTAPPEHVALANMVYGELHRALAGNTTITDELKWIILHAVAPGPIISDAALGEADVLLGLREKYSDIKPGDYFHKLNPSLRGLIKEAKAYIKRVTFRKPLDRKVDPDHGPELIVAQCTGGVSITPLRSRFLDRDFDVDEDEWSDKAIADIETFGGGLDTTFTEVGDHLVVNCNGKWYTESPRYVSHWDATFNPGKNLTASASTDFAVYAILAQFYNDFADIFEERYNAIQKLSGTWFHNVDSKLVRIKRDIRPHQILTVLAPTDSNQGEYGINDILGDCRESLERMVENRTVNPTITGNSVLTRRSWVGVMNIRNVVRNEHLNEVDLAPVNPRDLRPRVDTWRAPTSLGQAVLNNWVAACYAKISQRSPALESPGTKETMRACILARSFNMHFPGYHHRDVTVEFLSSVPSYGFYPGELLELISASHSTSCSKLVLARGTQPHNESGDGDAPRTIPEAEIFGKSRDLHAWLGLAKNHVNGNLVRSVLQLKDSPLQYSMRGVVRYGRPKAFIG